MTKIKACLYIAIGILFLLASCKNPEARKPISHSKPSEISQSIQRNKELINDEETLIREYIGKNPETDYLESSYGFWFAYDVRKIYDSIRPKTGDLVLFTYEVKNLRDELIYSSEEIGEQRYLVDKEDQLKGIRHALKILKEGETATFLFPSHLAYSFVGDKNKIGKNETLLMKITLNKIQKEN